MAITVSTHLFILADFAIVGQLTDKHGSPGI